MITTYFLRARLSTGLGAAGLSPAFVTFKYGDGTATPSAPAIAPVTGAAGWYSFAFAPLKDILCTVDLDPTAVIPLAGDARYADFVITPDDGAMTEARMISIVAGSTKANTRIKDPLYNEDGKLLSATLCVYASASDATTDTAPILSIDVVATYAGGNMDTYLAIET